MTYGELLAKRAFAEKWSEELLSLVCDKLGPELLAAEAPPAWEWEGFSWSR